MVVSPRKNIVYEDWDPFWREPLSEIRKNRRKKIDKMEKQTENNAPKK